MFLLRYLVLPASRGGKIKTVLQMVGICFLIFALDPTGRGLVAGTMATIGLALYWAAAVMTFISGFQYLWAGRDLLKR